MNTLMYPLKIVGCQGSQVIEHAKALVGTVNTASFNLTAVQIGPISMISKLILYGWNSLPVFR